MWPEPIELRGVHASLRPLAREHHDGLVGAVCDGELWRLWYTSVPSPERHGQRDRAPARPAGAGTMLPFAVFDSAGRVVGMTTYMNIDATHKRLEIGSTWYASACSERR